MPPQLPEPTHATPEGLQILGHRGARGLVPENTMASFAAALEHPIAGIELDVLLSKDEIPVVWHDPVLMESKLGARSKHLAGTRVEDLTAKELAHLDVGTALLEDFPRQQPHEAGISTLVEVLRFLLDHPRRPWVLLEIKAEPMRPFSSERTATAVVAALEFLVREGRAREDVHGRIVVESFDWLAVQETARLAPDLALTALTVEPGGTVYSPTVFPGSPWLGSIDLSDHEDILCAIASMGALGVAPLGTSVLGKKDPVAWVQRAHEQGLKVMPWTVNDPEEMLGLRDAGVDGIITDDPDVAVRTLDPQAWEENSAASTDS